MYPLRQFAVDGGLMSYNADSEAVVRQVGAYYVGPILKGAKPADMPIQQPTKSEFVINLKTATAPGLRLPPNLLATADEVIEILPVANTFGSGAGLPRRGDNFEDLPTCFSETPTSPPSPNHASASDGEPSEALAGSRQYAAHLVRLLCGHRPVRFVAPVIGRGPCDTREFGDLLDERSLCPRVLRFVVLEARVEILERIVGRILLALLDGH
jgi:hypothetical protein